jgi:hypothetical protein
LKLHREHYLQEKKGAGPDKLFEIAAAHSMPVLAKFLDLEAGQLGTLDRSCFQGSSNLPRDRANLPNDDGSISRLRSTRDADIGTYVPRWVAKGCLIFLRQLDHLSTADQLRSRPCFPVSDRLTNSISKRFAKPTLTFADHHPIAFDLLIDAVLRCKQTPDSQVVYLNNVLYHYEVSIGDHLAGDTRVPELDNIRQLLKDLRSDEVRGRLAAKFGSTANFPPPRFHINNSPALTGILVLHVQTLVRKADAELKRSAAVTLLNLHLYNILFQGGYLQSRWPDAELILNQLGLKGIFGTENRLKTWPAFFVSLKVSLLRNKQCSFLEPSKIMGLLHDHIVLGSDEALNRLQLYVLDKMKTKDANLQKKQAKATDPPNSTTLPPIKESDYAEQLTALGEILIERQVEMSFDFHRFRHESCMKMLPAIHDAIFAYHLTDKIEQGRYRNVDIFTHACELFQKMSEDVAVRKAAYEFLARKMTPIIRGVGNNRGRDMERLHGLEVYGKAGNVWGLRLHAETISVL